MASNSPAKPKRGRRLLRGAAAVLAVAAALAAAWAWVLPGGRSRPKGGNTLGNPPGMVDRLVTIDTPAAWAAGIGEGVDLASGPAPVLRLSGGEPQQYPRSGVWTSPAYEAEFP